MFYEIYNIITVKEWGIMQLLMKTQSPLFYSYNVEKRCSYRNMYHIG